MAKKILLIYPPSPVLNREDRCQQPTKDLLVIPPLPPTDLLYLASIAEQVGLEAYVRDYSLGGDFEQDLNDIQPDYLLANIATPTLENDINCFKIAKKILPKVINIAKGAVFLTYNSEIMLKNKEINYIISGEAEETLKELLEGEKKPKDILGLWYKEGFVAKFSGVRPFIENLDTLPFPARHLIILFIADPITTKFKRLSKFQEGVRIIVFSVWQLRHLAEKFVCVRLKILLQKFVNV